VGVERGGGRDRGGLRGKGWRMGREENWEGGLGCWFDIGGWGVRWEGGEVVGGWSGVG